MGQTLIIINETGLAYELMEKRSLKHSSRPSQVFAGEMYGHAIDISQLQTDAIELPQGGLEKLPSV
jgi:hypothetical protein